jgi:hypothetical protein
MTVPEQKLQGPLGSLEGLAENTREFQEVVQAFYSTLDAVHSRIRIIRVSLRLVTLAFWLPVGCHSCMY